MNLYISGSNRKSNCYKILSDLSNKNDVLVSLKNTDIKYCLGCGKCLQNLEKYCILNDNMIDFYHKIAMADKIIIASPIYFNQITGILKNFIDRLNPYSSHPELLKDKDVFLITIGTMEESENKEVENNINNYFNALAEIFEFNFKYLKNFTSQIDDNVEKNYHNYNDIIKQLKEKIVN